MENKKLRKKKNTNIVKIVLTTIGVVGIISMAVLTPNALQALDIFKSDKKKRGTYKYYTNTVITRLARQGYVVFEKTQKGMFVRLTDKGKHKIAKYELGEHKIPKPKKWDGIYRIVIFDIYENRRSIRDRLREHLERVGFVYLQQSVWVFPYECREFIILLKASFRVGKGILYIEASSIENDGWLKKHFKL